MLASGLQNQRLWWISKFLTDSKASTKKLPLPPPVNLEYYEFYSVLG